MNDVVYQIFTILVSIFAVPAIVMEIALYLAKHRIQKTRDDQRLQTSSAQGVERISLEYFRKIQRLTVIRFWVYAALILFTLLAYDVKAFSFFALAAGALVLTLKEQVQSLIAYFNISSSYEIGDDVRIKGTLGEIIRIKPLSVQMLGKEDNGEYDGKLISIPNFHFSNEFVERQELKSDNYRRALITAVYNKESFGIPFTEFITSLKHFLDEYLPVRSPGQVGNYKSFAGHKYKLNYEYDDEGDVMVKIRWISSPKLATERKERVVTFIEQLRS
jgi:Mechanosensitive ion channel